jgi:GntR family transcriptional regulator
MVLQIDFKSGKPVYLQVVDQIRYAAASGGLRPGEPLPSIRPLAEELRVNRNTIAKAYTELESQGIIETIPGKGCFLKENHSPFTKAVRQKLLITEIDEAVVTAHHLQVDRDTFLALVQERLDYLERKAAFSKTETGTTPSLPRKSP